MKRLITIFPICLLLVLVVQPAAAEFGSIELKETGVAPYKIITIYATNWPNGIGVYAGIYRFAYHDNQTPWNDISTWGFCIDLAQYSPSDYVTYVADDLENAPAPKNTFGSPMGANKADAIRALWGQDFSQVLTGTASQQAVKAAAFQVAVWEIIYENFPSSPSDWWDVTSKGTVNTNPGNGVSGFKMTGNSDVATQATQWLNGLDLTVTGTKESDLKALTNHDATYYYQDYAVQVPSAGTNVNPVPGPAGVVLGLCGLGLVGWFRKRFV